MKTIYMLTSYQAEELKAIQTKISCDASQQLGHASIQMTTMNYVNGIQNMRDVLSKL